MLPRLAILLSGSGSTYANLVDAITAGILPAEIAVVISSRSEAFGLQRARSYGHRTVVASSAADVIDALRAHGARYVAMCGWLKYFDPPADFANRVFNIHPSLLPAFGGKGMYGIHVHRAVLAAGATVSGCTVHRVSGAYDSGEILASSQVPVLSGDSDEALQQRVQLAERDLYPRVLAQQLAAGA